MGNIGVITHLQTSWDIQVSLYIQGDLLRNLNHQKSPEPLLFRGDARCAGRMEKSIQFA